MPIDTLLSLVFFNDIVDMWNSLPFLLDQSLVSQVLLVASEKLRMNTNYTDRITKTHSHMLEFLYYILIISVIFLNYIFS